MANVESLRYNVSGDGMTFRGKIHNGHVLLDEPLLLAEGTPVEIIMAEQASTDGGPDATLLQETLLNLAGIATGLPEDFARNHDHYIHGTPKKP